MCGLVGVVRLGAARPDDGERVARLSAGLAHRGPDGAGLLQEGPATLGHRRLAVIDLSERAAQPMRAPEAPVVLAYNGEVYEFAALREELRARGHAFASESDTEVVLRGYLEWGEGLWARLNGMFACAIWDGRGASGGRLVLARDPFGQKPLFYAELPGGELAFASELGPLEAVLAEADALAVDRVALAKYLCFDGFPAPTSMLQGVRQVPPACSVTWEAGRLGPPRPYWRRSYAVSRPRLGPRQAAGELWERLRAAVARHLVSDVPLGLFLSGGVDSSGILAAMASLLDPAQIRTFSIGFREPGYDERAAAAEVARHFGVRHEVEVLDSGRLLGLLPGLLDHLDAPLADASLVPTFALARFAREQVTVALGGDGGDELFAGYDTTLAERFARGYRRLPARARGWAARAARWLPLSSDKRSLQFRATRFVRGWADDPLERNQRWFGSFLPEEAAALVRGAPAPSELYAELGGLDPPPGEQAALELWTGIYLPTCVLTKVDRASMAVSLEVRAPLLDRELSEFVTGLPYSYKLRGLTRKWVLKQALRGRLPERILRRSKQGFGVPCGEWLRGPLREEAAALFEPAALARRGLLEPDLVARLFAEHLARRADHRKQLWALYVLLRWLERRPGLR